jgi:hypothetical protein
LSTDLRGADSIDLLGTAKVVAFVISLAWGLATAEIVLLLLSALTGFEDLEPVRLF